MISRLKFSSLIMLSFFLPQQMCNDSFQVGILKRVLEEVEKIMYEFKGMLYKSLEDPKIEFRNVCSSYTCMLHS